MTVYDVSEIAPNLYQGANPPQGATLHELGFDVLVLCAEERQPPPSAFPGLRLIYTPMDDWRVVPKALASAVARQVAQEVRRGRRVYVACNMGCNRSGLVVALTLRLLTGKSGLECVRHVQRRRPSALFNHWFRGWLVCLPALRRRTDIAASSAA